VRDSDEIQSMHSTECVHQIGLHTMTKQANTQASSSSTKVSASAPVEISLDLLQQVSGGSPKGGWIVEPPEAVALSLAVESPSPKGGW